MRRVEDYCDFTRDPTHMLWMLGAELIIAGLVTYPFGKYDITSFFIECGVISFSAWLVVSAARRIINRPSDARNENTDERIEQETNEENEEVNHRQTEIHRPTRRATERGTVTFLFYHPPSRAEDASESIPYWRPRVLN